MYFKTFEDFSLFTDILFFNFFSFLKCLMYMLICTSTPFYRKLSTFELAVIIMFTKTSCRHPQHIFMIFAMFQVFKTFSFAIFSVNLSDSV